MHDRLWRCHGGLEQSGLSEVGLQLPRQHRKRRRLYHKESSVIRLCLHSIASVANNSRQATIRNTYLKGKESKDRLG